MADMETTTVELPVELGRALDELGKRTGRSRAEVISEALHAFLGRQDRTDDDPTWPRSIGMGEADQPRADAIDEWLKANWRPEDDWGRS